MITIWKPEMHADTGRPIVGLAYDKVLREREIVQVQITYRRKDGSLKWPNIFEMARANMAGYPEKVHKGIRLIMIPLDAFKEEIVR